ncbi:hypothetical protein JX265_001601 [Neoarthrinium moseri]|uniref:Pyridoxamine 5'-phosphate oxidase N-terminal domain-containing protein n=1 Tax=Neoarthrinium moseri TaxID=1658444 RepID=A0A9P9WVA9_9PEZI|nr:uncharacterized protein JN550_003996 [Neoarthrinium moseri]KAI1872277.1 hypothetical protein JN550_003996 [Neoarthrinium moseri]KAI1879980.1 hypothetical protein JX265_001601 [Neoarthrinium moseri]
MGAYFETIPKSLIKWILDQKVFWVSTAPLAGSGHVNVSPKGGAYFGVIDEKTFWYMDLTGSGNETISHLYENGRITVLFNAFEGPPRILRLFGHGTVLEYETPEFTDFVKAHDVKTIPGSRAIIIVDIHQVGTSCGFSVPYYDFKDFRPILNDFFEKKAEKFAAGNENESMPRYWALKNSWSVDGLPGVRTGQKTMKEEGIVPLKKMVGAAAPESYKSPVNGFSLAQLLFAVILSALLSAFLVLHGNEVVDTLKAALTHGRKRPIWGFSPVSV